MTISHIAPTGYRGYIASRPILGHRTPQQVQNLVVRDFAAKHGLPFLLSATEYTMAGCFLVLEGVLNEIETLDGMIIYRLFMLPSDDCRRRHVYERILSAGATLYAAVEGDRITNTADIERVEDIWQVMKTMKHCPQTV